MLLMGHSTGSQDVLHYVYHQSEQQRPPVDGAILQAAVSDREGLAMMCEKDQNFQHAYEECLRISLNSKAESPQGLICALPPDLTSRLGWPRGHVSCKRFLSLASPFSPVRPDSDDLFSSDLSDETQSKTFGAVGRSGLLNSCDIPHPSMLVLLSEKDQYTPITIDKETLIARWASALENGHARIAPSSGVIPGASHNVKEHLAQFELIKRVFSYLDLIAGGLPGAVNRKLVKDAEYFEKCQEK